MAFYHRQTSQLQTKPSWLLLSTLFLCSLANNTLAQGIVYVSSLGGDQVLRYDATTGAFLDTLITVANNGTLDQPHGTLDRGTDLLVVSFGTDEILRYNRETGEPLGTFIPSTTGLNNPVYMALGPDNLLYVSSQASDEILRFNASTGAFVSTFVTAGLSGPSGFAFGPDGRLYVAGRFSGNVIAYDGLTGAFDEVVADTTDGLATGNTFGLQFGNNDDLYFVSNNQTFRYDLDTQAILATLPTGGIGLEPGPSGGVFVATANNLRLIDSSDNSVGSPFLGPGGTINTLNFFHFSFLEGPTSDFNTDGDVDSNDLATWQAAFGLNATGDTNTDTDSDGADFLIWQQQFGAGLPSPLSSAATVVPEPSSMTTTLLLLIIIFSNSRKQQHIGT